MTAGWTILALIAAAATGGIAALLARRGHRRRSISDRRRGAAADRFDRLDRRVAHYRASGALPRWDP